MEPLPEEFPYVLSKSATGTITKGRRSKELWHKEPTDKDGFSISDTGGWEEKNPSTPNRSVIEKSSSHVFTRLKIHKRISIKEQTVGSNLLMHRCILTGDVFKSSGLK